MRSRRAALAAYPAAEAAESRAAALPLRTAPAAWMALLFIAPLLLFLAVVYIIPFFGNLIDGYSSKVQGLNPSKGTLNLDSFGHGYRTIWFS